MEVQLTSDQRAKLDRMAAEQGRAAETLVQEAVERLLNYDDWFSREVEKGLAAANRAEFIVHGDIHKIIDIVIRLNARALDAARSGRSFTHLRLQRRTSRRAAQAMRAADAIYESATSLQDMRTVDE